MVPSHPARATALQLRRHQVMKVTIEQIRNIIPAAIARITIPFQTSVFFSTSSRSSGITHLFTTQPFKPRQAAILSHRSATGGPRSRIRVGWKLEARTLFLATQSTSVRTKVTPLCCLVPACTRRGFDTGKGAYIIRSSKGNAAEILRRLNLYVKANRKTIEGLVNRRRPEAEMFVG